MNITDLDTPTLVADLDVLEGNINGMAALCDQIGIPLRVHTKTHKVPEIAKLQVAAGSQGITCQKLGEAEAMVDAGVDTVVVALDSAETATGIFEQAIADSCVVPVIVELDTGSGRCGVQSPQAAQRLAQQIMKMQGIDFQGVMTYPSNSRAKPFIEETLDLLSSDGIPVNIISGGGTGSEAASKEIGCTETRSGSYVYEGMTRIGSSEMLTPERCVLRVVTTVVSTPTPVRIIIDGGMKTFASYPPTPYGHIVEHPDAKIYGMSVEHGHVNVSECSHQFKVGEQLSVIPLHQGMTSNLHDELVGVRDNKVEAIWKIAGRGRVK